MDEFTETSSSNVLPHVGTIHFPQDELLPHTQVPGRRYALVPILLSVCLHSIGLYSLISLRVESPSESDTVSASLRLRLVQPAPERQQALSSASQVVRENETQVQRAPAAPPLPPPRVELPKPRDTLVFIDPATPFIPTPDSLAPTRLSVRQIVDQLRREEEEQEATMIPCTPQQKRNPMLLCSDETSTLFIDTTRNLFFADSLVSANESEVKTQRISNSLRKSGMAQGDIDRYLEGIDVNAQDKSTSADARAGAMRDQMFSNDSTYQLMKRVLNP